MPILAWGLRRDGSITALVGDGTCAGAPADGDEGFVGLSHDGAGYNAKRGRTHVRVPPRSDRAARHIMLPLEKRA